jgi:hypothetical protein
MLPATAAVLAETPHIRSASNEEFRYKMNTLYSQVRLVHRTASTLKQAFFTL